MDMDFEIDVGEGFGLEMELGDEYGLEFAWNATNTVFITPCLGLEVIRSYGSTGICGSETIIKEV